mgnify:CR=1 FL=1
MKRGKNFASKPKIKEKLEKLIKQREDNVAALYLLLVDN